MPEICQFLEWDSRFFDMRIARVQEQRLDDTQLEAVMDWCRRNQIECLYFLADSADETSTRVVEQAGFSFVDIRMVLGRSLSGFSNPPPASNRVLVRPWQPADLPVLQGIAAGGFGKTRFYFDPGFARQAVDSLYQTWITKSCYGYAQAVLVAIPADPPNTTPCGFITTHLEQPQSTQPDLQILRGSIGLLGIDPAARRQGVGQSLVENSLSWFAAQGVDQVSVVTQGRNINAQRLYQRCHFLTQSVQLWYHRWFR